MVTMKNEAVRSAAIEAIDGAHLKTRRTVRGANKVRGALVSTKGRYGDSDRRLGIVGEVGARVVRSNYRLGEPLEGATDDEPAAWFFFYAGNGVLAHEEPASAEMEAWFAAQFERGQ
jgi:hypothetical protein